MLCYTYTGAAIYVFQRFDLTSHMLLKAHNEYFKGCLHYMKIWFPVNPEMQFQYYLFDLILYIPVNNFSVLWGRVSLGWSRTKQGLQYIAQGHIAVMPVRIELATPGSWVKLSTIEPLWSPTSKLIKIHHLMNNSIDPDQLVSSEASLSGSTLFSKEGTETAAINSTIYLPKWFNHKFPTFLWLQHSCSLQLQSSRDPLDVHQTPHSPYHPHSSLD